MKLVTHIALLIFCSLPLQAGPFDEFLERRKDIVENIGVVELILRAQIDKLNIAAALRDPRSKLDAAEIAELKIAIGRVTQFIFAVDFAFGSIDKNFMEVAPLSRAASKFRALRALFLGLNRSLENLLFESNSLEDVIGRLNRLYLIIVDTSGNLLDSVGAAKSLYSSIDLRPKQLAELCVPLMVIFDRSSTYVLQRKTAPWSERQVVAELRLMIAELLTIGYLRDFLSNGCPGFLGNMELALKAVEQ